MTYFGFDYHRRWTQAVAMDERGRILRGKGSSLCFVVDNFISVRIKCSNWKGVYVSTTKNRIPWGVLSYNEPWQRPTEDISGPLGLSKVFRSFR